MADGMTTFATHAALRSLWTQDIPVPELTASLNRLLRLGLTEAEVSVMLHAPGPPPGVRVAPCPDPGGCDWPWCACPEPETPAEPQETRR